MLMPLIHFPLCATWHLGAYTLGHMTSYLPALVIFRETDDFYAAPDR